MADGEEDRCGERGRRRAGTRLPEKKRKGARNGRSGRGGAGEAQEERREGVER